MQKFVFSVDIVASELDRNMIAQTISDALDGVLPGDVHSAVKVGEVKKFTEQGYKVWRARVTNVTAEQAGDSANPKKSKNVSSAKEEQEVEA